MFKINVCPRVSAFWPEGSDAPLFKFCPYPFVGGSNHSASA
jgi:hypothetical protein